MTVPSTQVIEVKDGPGLLVRAIWFIFVGWWLTGIVMAIAWVAGLTVIGLPLMVYLVNRLPTFLTLRPRRQLMVAVTDETGRVTYRRASTEQYSILVRAIWILLVGGWLSGIVMGVAWILCVTLMLFPLGLMLINRVPFIYSLHRGYA